MNTYTHTKTKQNKTKDFTQLTPTSVASHTHKALQNSWIPSPHSHSKIIGGKESLYKDNIRHKPEVEGVSGGITCSHESWKFLGAFDIKK